jgi:hypothetical protein
VALAAGCLLVERVGVEAANGLGRRVRLYERLGANEKTEPFMLVLFVCNQEAAEWTGTI